MLTKRDLLRSISISCGVSCSHDTNVAQNDKQCGSICDHPAQLLIGEWK